MANPDLTDPGIRTTVISDIKQEDNISRKREHQRRYDVWRERQDRYILERLQREFSASTVAQMRKVFSINLVPRIINELSLYTRPPERTFFTTTGREITEPELKQLNALYEVLCVDAEMARSNDLYNLHDQVAIMVVPDRMGKIKVKGIPPFQYDVIPQAFMVERAFSYILNVWDFDLRKSTKGINSEPTQLSGYRQSDNTDQVIADDSDRKALENLYSVWSDQLHFTMNGNGQVVDAPTDGINPIQELPFVDVARDKDFQFFVRRGTSLVDFALDFGLILSDTANTIRLQSYSQAIMTSEKKPQDLLIGTNTVLWMPLDPNNPSATPKFEFVSPSPDIGGSLDFAEMTLRLFLSSRGLDPATISGKGDSKSFSSGLERLLAMIDKFEASKADIALFEKAEKDVFKLIVKWSNLFQDVSGEGELDDDLRFSKIGDDVRVNISFDRPTALQTTKEKEDSVFRRLDEGVITEKMSIMELEDLDEEGAEQRMRDLEEEVFKKMERARRMNVLLRATGVVEEEVKDEDDEEKEEEIET